MAQSLHSSNHLLASLHPDKMAALLPHLRVVELPQETVLYERDDTIKAVYFPHEGAISLVVDLASGDMIEAAMVGRDSVAGGSSAFDNQISLNRAVVQITGRASALNVDHFRALAAQSNTFRAKLARHEHFILAGYSLPSKSRQRNSQRDRRASSAIPAIRSILRPRP
jgi:CRP-like cAMP-binding protein